MPLGTRRRVLAAKAEATPGTAETVDATNAKIMTYGLTMQSTAEVEQREADGAAAGSYTGVRGPQPGTCSFEVDVRGKGATGLPDWASVLLPACRMSLSTATFSPQEALASAGTVTLVCYEDGLIKTLHGAMGTWKLKAAAGKIGKIEFNFQGIFSVAVADGSILSPTHETAIPPIVGSGACTFGGITPLMSSLEIDYANSLVTRPAPNARGIVHAVAIRGVPKFSMDPEAVLVATQAPFADMFAGTTRALSVVIGSAAQNTVTFSIPYGQLTSVNEGDRNGLVTHAVQGFAAKSTGSDEITIVFS